MRDRAQRKRGREHRAENRGEQHPLAKLTEKQVRAIIVELGRVPRRSQTDIAEMFGVSQQTISRIYHRKGWAHLWKD